MRGLLAIVVAFTFMSCATVGADFTKTYDDLIAVDSDGHEFPTNEDGEVDHSDDYGFGWNYLFPFEGNSQYYIISYFGYNLKPLAVVAPINFYMNDSDLTRNLVGTWVWCVIYKTDLNDGFEMGVVADAEAAVEAAEEFMDRVDILIGGI